MSLSGRKLMAENGDLCGIFRNLNRILIKGTFLSDVIGTFISILGLFALLFYQVYGLVIFDALGAIVAALFMMVGSLMLMAQARALITGRSFPEKELKQLRDTILADSKVEAVNQLAAIYAGASQILIDTDLDLSETLKLRNLEAARYTRRTRAEDTSRHRACTCAFKFTAIYPRSFEFDLVEIQ